MLDGETVTNVVKPIGYVLARKRSGGGEFHGALHITNFRLILQRTGAGEVRCGGMGYRCDVMCPVVCCFDDNHTPVL